MVKVVKSEWHQVEKVYGLELDNDLLSEIYPDLDDTEIENKLKGIEDGSVDIDEVFNDAMENDVDIDWDYLDQDDWWTDRKGGYEISYKVENWEYREQSEPPKTHKCTKCRWCGTRWESKTEFYNEDGSIHTEDDLEHHHTKEICPMCDSPLELTEEGIADKKRMDELSKELEAAFDDTEDDENVGTPPSDEEFAEQQAVLESMDENKKSAWPWTEQKVEEKPIVKLPISYPAGEYKIILYGRGQDHGFAQITKGQYDYWHDKTEMLHDVFNGDYDYDEEKVPKKARFEVEYYNELCDHNFYGPDDDCYIEIKDSDGNTIVEKQLSEYMTEIHTDDDYYEHFTEQEEFYIQYDCEKGYVIHWAQGGKGTYFETNLVIPEGELFDPRKLFFFSTDVEGNTLITQVLYGEEKLDNWGGDWSGKWGEYWLHKVEKK